MKKYHWINDEVKIDFQIPEVINNTMQEAEHMDSEENMEYFCIADTLDMLCKEAYVNKILTKEQWLMIVRRYPA